MSILERRLRAERRPGARWPTRRCGPGWTGWRRRRRVGTRRSPSWPATCGSTTSTSPCSRRWSRAEDDGDRAGALDALEADPDGPGRAEAVAASGGLASPAARGAAAALAGAPTTRTSGRCCSRSTPAASTAPASCGTCASTSTTASCCAPPTTTGRTSTSTSSSRYARARRGCPSWPGRWPSTCVDVPQDRQRHVVDLGHLARRPSTCEPTRRRRWWRTCWRRCDFGRAPWRVDVTVTSTGGDEAEHLRTLHLTYRPKAGGGSPRTRSTATCIRCWPSGWTCGGWPTSGSSGWPPPRTSTSSTGWPTTTRRTIACSRSPRCAT